MQNLKVFAGVKNSNSASSFTAKQIKYTTKNDLRKATQPRDAYVSKNSGLGSLVIVAGSNEYYGPAALAGRAAYDLLAGLRIGTGYACLFVPSFIDGIVKTYSANLIVRPLGKNKINEASRQEIKDLKGWIGHSSAFVIGMGIGRKNVQVRRFEAKLLDYALAKNTKIVVDADGIYALKYIKMKLNKNVVLTPHDREFMALTGVMPDRKNIKERVRLAKTAAEKMNAVIVLKGHESVITDGHSVKLNKAKTSALATMGTGDVLSGIIGGYLALGASGFEAATAGVYLHSVIGDTLAKKMGTHILASDVVNYIPNILKGFDKSVR